MRIAKISAALLACGFALTAPAAAQTASIGVKGGVSISTLAGSDIVNADYHTAIAGGAFAHVGLGRYLGLQPEVLYVRKGAQSTQGSATGKLLVDYVEVPLLLTFDIPASADGAFTPYLMAGPAIAFQTRCEISLEQQGSTTSAFACDDPFFEGGLGVKSVDYSLAFGAGARIRLGTTSSFVLDGRYDLGLGTIDDTSNPGDIKNRAFLILAGFAFQIGGR